MTEVIHTQDLKKADVPASKRAARLAKIYGTPFAKLSEQDKDFLLQEVALRLGLLAPRTEDT